MDETNTELDSFTAAMLARVRARKEHLDRLDDEDDGVGAAENENNKSLSEESLSEDDDSLLLANMPTDDKDRHLRKSLSILLDVRKPALPGTEEPEVQSSPVKFATTTRLNKRLGQLKELYNDEGEGVKVLTQNKVNIAPAAEEVEKPKVGLKDRINNLARFYYPIHDDDDVSKASTPTKMPSSKVQPINTPFLASKPKIVKFIEQFDTPSKPASPEKIVKKQPQPLTPAALPKPANSAPVKKSSVADLKKLFENKAEEEQPKPKEVAPELLSLREKKRLFEKAIREESEASKNVYRGGQRRVMELSPTRSDEGEAKRLKSNTELQEDVVKFSPKNADDQHQNDNDYMSICTNSTSTSIEETEESHAEEDSSDVLKVSTVSVTDSLDKALESIDNYSISPSAVSSEFADTVGDITFSAIETDQALQRSSTKVELKSDSQSSVEILQSQEKPEPVQLSTVPEAANPNADDPPPMRTISFYRREQKAKLAEIARGAFSPAPIDNKLKRQQAEDQQRAAREEFLHNVNNRIVFLKNDISEHNRIYSQASQALSLTYQATTTDSELIEGRVEAERLLLIAEEKRNACKREIDRLKRLQLNPNEYISQSIPSRGLLKISNLSIPLRKEFVELRAKGKASTYFFICLVINGPQVYVSELLDTSKSPEKDSLEFKFKAYCKDLKEDFKVGVHLYAMELQSHTAPKKEAGFRSFRIKFGTSSLKKAEKAALANANSPLPSKLTAGTGGSSSSFNLVGVVKLTLALLRQNPLLYRFEYPAAGPKLGIPIDNYLSIREQSLSVQHRLTSEGFFDIQDPKNSLWNLRRVVIDGSQLKYWRFPDTTSSSDDEPPPLGMINLKHCINPVVTILKGELREICMRDNTIVLVTLKPPPISNAQKLVQGGKISKSLPEKFFISSTCKDSIQQLAEQINKVLGGIRAWENDAVRPYSVDEFNRLYLTNHS